MAPNVSEWVSGSGVLEQYRALADELGAALGEMDDERLAKLHEASRELAEDLARLVLGAERGRLAMHRLREIGTPSELLEVAPREASTTADLDRVLLSRLDKGYLVAESLHIACDPHGAALLLSRLQDLPEKLDYPLVEWEVLRRRRPLLVHVNEEDAPRRHLYQELMQWESYVTTPLVMEGRVVGFLHGDNPTTRRTLSDTERDALGMFGIAFPAVYERAVLRHRLRVQHHEMRQVATWADARTSELSDRAITLAQEDDEPTAAAPPPSYDGTLSNITRRESEVLNLVVKGESNGRIAQELFISEETVKFHVKNILRKMGASNRSELTAQYLKLTLSRRDPRFVAPLP